MGLHRLLDTWLEGWRWRIARWLDSRFDDACWFVLCEWAQGVRSTPEVFWLEKWTPKGAWRTQDCTVQSGGAYCGKCEKTGRLIRERHEEDTGPWIVFSD